MLATIGSDRTNSLSRVHRIHYQGKEEPRMPFTPMSRRRLLQLSGGGVAAGAFGGLLGPAFAQSRNLRMWDQFTAEPGTATYQAVLDAWQAATGNVIERTIQPGNTISQVAGTALASGTGPDIIQYSVGKGNAGVLASAGLVIPLDDYAEKYNWRGRLSPIAVVEAELDGKLYGAPQEAEVTLIFVNKTLFDQHGLQVPTTHAEAVEFAKAAAPTGLIPLAYGELDAHPSWWAFSHVVSNALGAKAASDLVFSNIGSYNTPEVIDGIEKFWVEYKQAGGFLPEVNSLASADAQAVFETGGAFMLMSGTWAAGTIEQSLAGSEIDIIPLWSFDGKPRAYPTGVGSAMYISAASEHKDVAAEFIDHLYSDEVAVAMLEKAGLIAPLPLDPSTLQLSDFQKRSVSSVTTGDGDPSINQGVFVNHGLSGPEFLRMMTSGFQAMQSGEKTSAQQAADLQAAWEADNAKAG